MAEINYNGNHKKNGGNSFIIPAALAVAIVSAAYMIGKDQGVTEEELQDLNSSVRELQSRVQSLEACAYFDVECKPPSLRGKGGDSFSNGSGGQPPVRQQ